MKSIRNRSVHLVRRVPALRRLLWVQSGDPANRPGVRSAAFADFELRFALLYRDSPETCDSTSSWFQGVLHFKPPRSACWLARLLFR